MNYAQRIADELGIQRRQAAATIDLFDAGNTLPFIARYRKEQTGSLDEEQLRRLKKLLDGLRAIESRRQTIIATIEEQGNMTPELRSQLLDANSLTELEDLYRPYKPKRRTRADVAREKGLQGLADRILEQPHTDETLEEIAQPFLCEDVPTAEEALAGARDIAAQTISDHPQVRSETRDKALRWSRIRAEKKASDDEKDPQGTYRLYYEFHAGVTRLRPHQILALNRGESEEILRVSVDVPERAWFGTIVSVFPPDDASPLHQQLVMAIEDAAERLLLPAVERDVRRNLTERAQAHAIRIFADNVRALLQQPPLGDHTVLGIDPGFRTGCKVAVVDRSGRVLDTATIYPHEPQKHQDEALETLRRLVKQHRVTLLTIGNGTASRETEQLAATLISETGDDDGSPPLRYLMVDETGASVYSASPLASAELPDLDVSLRGAVSIARRVQDPLAELVKIDPRSLGVGMYQHDLNQAQLEAALDEVVESVVNNVGVDLNTASPALLTHIAGIGPTLADRIVAHRDAHGPFSRREALEAVEGIGPKTFKQAAGFLRVRGGDNPLDASAIHPESYDVAESVLDIAGLTTDTPPARRADKLVGLLEEWPLDELAEELDVGSPTLADIFRQLVQPGRDPRQDVPAPILRSDVLKMEDLEPHLRLRGTVRNVVDFGAFIDVGVKNDGLLHRSQIPEGVMLQVGDVVDIEILKVEPDRGRISLGWPDT
ncbi:MAG: Tex family protein [Anaerolineae bacterium]|jgi:uncharacterized protein